MKAPVLASFFAVALGGCTVGPEYRRPDAQLPASWTVPSTSVSNGTGSALALGEWWRSFDDPLLNRLIQEAVEANLELKIAAARVREARAARLATSSGYWPQVGAGADYSRARLSENGPLGRTLHDAGRPLENDLFTAGLDASWEIDVFGGTRRAVEAAGAELDAAEEARRDVLVILLAEVAGDYIELRGLQRRLDVVRSNLRAQEETRALTRLRFQAGMASELSVAQADALTATTRSRIPDLETGIEETAHRLSVLLGKPPAALKGELAVPAAIPAGPPEVPAGLPADLLRRRPDLRRAERAVAAATARVGQAKAELFPKFYLTGAAGLQSIEAADFFEGGSRFFSLGPTIRWPIFTAVRLRRNIDAHTAREEHAVPQYDLAVLRALEDVENALIAHRKERETWHELTAAEAAHRRARELAEDQFKAGLGDFLNVLDAERALLATEEQLVSSERGMSLQLVRLYKALGGGWETTSNPSI